MTSLIEDKKGRQGMEGTHLLELQEERVTGGFWPPAL